MANKGKMLEKAIRKLFAAYESYGIHCQQNFPEQLYDGTLINRHGFDFQIFYKGRFIAFDAKECARSVWYLDKAKLHQVKALFDIYSNGGEAFFLVYFTGSKRLIKFRIDIVKNALSNKINHLSPEDGEATTINLLGIEKDENRDN